MVNVPSPPVRRRPWQPRFTIIGMMLTTLVISVVAAGVGYLVRHQGKGRFGHLVFLLITLASPLVVVTIISLARAAIMYATRPPKKRRSPDVFKE